MARGILAESQDLARNALAHRSPAAEVTDWICDVIVDVLGSPAVTALAGEEVLVTGAVRRGDAVPTSRVSWLASPTLADDDLRDFLRSAGLEGSRVEATPLLAADAGANSETRPADSLSAAIEHRPPALSARDGLPDPDSIVDIDGALLTPIAHVARWAAGGTANHVLRTARRLESGASTGRLSPGELDDLLRARATGLELAWARWRHRHEAGPDRWADLPALERSAYGEATRTVSMVIRAIAAREDTPITEEEA